LLVLVGTKFWSVEYESGQGGPINVSMCTYYSHLSKNRCFGWLILSIVTAIKNTQNSSLEAKHTRKHPILEIYPPKLLKTMETLHMTPANRNARKRGLWLLL
jgi:hypothetical protein